MSQSLFFSTNLKAEKVSFKRALLKGLAPDGGLYMPEIIPSFTKKEIQSFTGKEYYEIAFDTAWKYLHDEFEEAELLALIKDA